MTETTEKLNKILTIMNDGVEFYDEALEEVKNSDVRSLLVDIQASKRKLASQLTSQVEIRGEEAEDDGSIVGAMRTGYGKMRAFFGDTDKAFVSELEEHEDRALHTLQDVLEDDDVNADGRAVLTQFMPAFQSNHDRMKALKESL